MLLGKALVGCWEEEGDGKEENKAGVKEQWLFNALSNLQSRHVDWSGRASTRETRWDDETTMAIKRTVTSSYQTIRKLLDWRRPYV